MELPESVKEIIEDNINSAFVPMLLAAPAMLEALKGLREDFRMLLDGEWQPDEDSIQASMERATEVIELVERE